jgi:NAD(P)-dependent dehydrogenase (short-subunit alcohol dehydrogenase family)
MANEKRVAVVTGASGAGMGRSIALTLSREGFSVVVNYLNNLENAEAVAAHIRMRGGDAIVAQGNVFEKSGCEALFQAALSAYGRVDAAIIGPGADFHGEKPALLKSELATQDAQRELAPVYNMLPLALTEMGKRRWGRIVGIASNMDIPSPAYAYNAAKAARIDALRLAAGEAWKLGVTVNVVSPGPVDPFKSLEEACARCYRAKKPAEREKVTPQDVAEGVAFLCSDAADYVTGCVLPYRF